MINVAIIGNGSISPIKTARKWLILALIPVLTAGIAFAVKWGGGGGLLQTACPGTKPSALTGFSGDRPPILVLLIRGSCGITLFSPPSRQLIYEPLFIFNFLDARLYPRLAEICAWNGQIVLAVLSFVLITTILWFLSAFSMTQGHAFKAEELSAQNNAAALETP